MADTDETVETLNIKITSLRNALDSGVLSVRHGETSTTFRGASEMQLALSRMIRRRDLLAGTQQRRIYYPWQSSKAL